jgi:reductive dehalogenase
MNHWEKYQEKLVGPIQRFNQRNDVFRRTDWDPNFIALKKRFRDREGRPNRPGHSQMDYAFADAAWYLEDHFALGNAGSNQEGLYAWDGLDGPKMDNPKVDLNPMEAAKIIKKTARFFGASLVGVTELNRLWLYSHVVDDLTGEITELNIPDGYRYAVVMAVEMAHDYIQTSPANGSSAATGLGYSKMAFIAGLLSKFIRGLGYGAIPCGNDTALSIPLAIEAGLGELGRHGILITEKFGPRVRLCKVFTDLPLEPDEPHFFGVERFCEVCKKCADLCLSKAIPFGDQTTEALTLSNNSGVKKWMINPEQCYRFWAANRADCSTCIRVCPFNQKPGWHHDLVRFFVKRVPLLNPFFLWIHDVLGYADPKDPESMWG